MTWWVSLLVLLSAGCSASHYNKNRQPVPGCMPPPARAYDPAMRFPSFHVQANASADITAGDVGYAVTADGRGTYRLAWSDTQGFDTCFTGLITAFDNFAQTDFTGLSGYETIQLVAPNQIAFSSIPEATRHGVDFFVSKNPAYVDVAAGGNATVNIYYVDAQTSLLMLTGANPVAFSSP
jgi:hypothetical protein